MKISGDLDHSPNITGFIDASQPQKNITSCTLGSSFSTASLGALPKASVDLPGAKVPGPKGGLFQKHERIQDNSHQDVGGCQPKPAFVTNTSIPHGKHLKICSPFMSLETFPEPCKARLSCDIPLGHGA